MSKATIVSMLPFDWNREMIGHDPAYYQIPKAERDDFNILVIGDGRSNLYVFDGKSVPRMHLAISEANELVDTYIAATLYTDINSRPGLFVLDGEFTKDQIKEKFGSLLEERREQQINWFNNLIRQADDDWKKARLHRMISGPQRAAAESLGLKREWMLTDDFKLSDCPACGTAIKSNIAVCPVCKAIIDQERASQFEFAS